MEIKKLIKKEQEELIVDESEIQYVILRSKEIFFKQEEKKISSYYEFIRDQFYMIRKRWWIYQFILLCLAWQFISTEQDLFYINRGMGIFAALFVIFLVPELWKNLTNRCVEIEIASYYSLNQIYAARILLFGFIDVFLLTIFSGSVHFILRVSFTYLITQFLLPMIVAACICFLVLCKQYWSGNIAIGSCVLWSAVWWELAANDSFYALMTPPAWIAVFIVACMFLLFNVYRLLKNCDKYAEVNLKWSCH